MQDKLKFLLLFIFEIPAIFITIIIFIYFIFDQGARSKPKNHIWIILLILNFLYLITYLPMPMSYFYLGNVWPGNNIYCIWWTWYEFCLNTLGLYLMAWASIERHIFIFYSHRILRIRWKIWIFHFIPIIICFIWILSFHFIFIVISPNCTTIWKYSDNVCGMPCFLNVNNDIYGLIEFIGNIILPLFIITCANIALIIRVIYEKISHHQIINWRRQRKMTFQLSFISSLYLTCWLPLTSSQLYRMTTTTSFFLENHETMVFIIYFIPLLLPFVCLNTFAGLIEKMREIIQRHIRTNRINVAIVHRV